MIPLSLWFAGAAVLSFFAVGCNKTEPSENKPGSKEAYHPDTLKPLKTDGLPKRGILNGEDFRKDRYHSVIPQLYSGLKSAGISDSGIDRGYLSLFQEGGPKRIANNDHKLSPLELFITALDVKRKGTKEKKFEKIFTKITSNPDLRLFYGKALFHSGRHEKAEEVFMEIIKEDKKTSYLAVSYLGDLLRLRGEFDKAERAYRSALRKMPSEFITPLHLGDMLIDIKRYGAAEDVFLRLWEQNQHRDRVGPRLSHIYKHFDEPFNAEQYMPDND